MRTSFMLIDQCVVTTAHQMPSLVLCVRARVRACETAERDWANNFYILIFFSATDVTEQDGKVAMINEKVGIVKETLVTCTQL